MGQISPKQEQLLRRMEGGEVGLSGAVHSVTTRFVNKLKLETVADEALSHQPSMKAFEEMLGGLVLEFEKRRVDIPIEHLPPKPMDLILIRSHGDVLPEGPIRVTSLRGFLYLHYSLGEVSSDLDLLKKSTQKRLVGHQDAHNQSGEEECPICMDRPIDTVLSCSHGICKVCEIEWLVGEGRGTCPLCRAKEKEGDDWVLNGKEVFLSVDRQEVHDRVKRAVTSIFTFILSLPTWTECRNVLRLSSVSGMGLDAEEEIYDGLGCWLRAELSYMNASNSSDSRWARCPRCTTAVRIPQSATEETRLNCTGCRSLWTVERLSAIS